MSTTTSWHLFVFKLVCLAWNTENVCRVVQWLKETKHGHLDARERRVVLEEDIKKLVYNVDELARHCKLIKASMGKTKSRIQRQSKFKELDVTSLQLRLHKFDIQLQNPYQQKKGQRIWLLAKNLDVTEAIKITIGSLNVIISTNFDSNVLLVIASRNSSIEVKWVAIYIDIKA